MSAATDKDRVATRMKIVDEHVERENLHDADGVTKTWGSTVRFSFPAAGEQHEGFDNVRALYAELFEAFPDIRFEELQRHIASDAIVLEVVLSGTHQDMWRGIPATGKRISLQTCAIFVFDEHDALVEEKVYLDGAAMLVQLGLLPPQ